MLSVIAALLFAGAATATVIPTESKTFVQSVRIVAVSTAPLANGTTAENSTYVMDVKAFGLSLSTSIPYLDTNNTFIAVSTFTGNVFISSGLLLGGSAGTNGQCLVGGGAGAIPTWGSCGGGGGFDYGPSTAALSIRLDSVAGSTNALSASTVSIVGIVNSTAGALSTLQTNVAASTTTLFNNRASSGTNADITNLTAVGLRAQVSASTYTGHIPTIIYETGLSSAIGAGTGLMILGSTTVPANVLSAIGDSLFILCEGTMVVTSENKLLVPYFGGVALNTVINTTAISLRSDAWITKQASNMQNGSSMRMSATTLNYQQTVLTATDTGTVLAECRGQSSTGGELGGVTLTHMLVMSYPK